MGFLMAKAKLSTKPTGLQAGALYPQGEFCDRLGIGRKAFVAMRRKGLPVRKLSRRIVVDSDEAREWLRSQPKLATVRAAS